MGCFGVIAQWVKSLNPRRKDSRRLIIGPPTDFRRVEFTLPLYDKEDAMSDENPSESDTLYRVSKREKLQQEAIKLKEKLTANMDGTRLRPLRQHT
ncbi:hypothetical protein AJ79_05206 [Helicocarpus griseus UAMH5409]|uniref:Uncharacterized protein n=1 Tax=Helicocarpus griseus UAMH5409 TaxID=1447875 RepID=A0A2B7XNV3_9EURO|nr:hypothetical protein AJ79_05206 [Helicocarpus griseus UAMH5409]